MAACSQNITLVPGIELSPQEANRYKNIFAVQVPMCEVFRAVLKWECSDKQLGQTCADYFGQKKQQYEDRHAALVAEKNNKFKLPKIVLPTRTIEMLQEEPSKYDVTLMFSFLCEIFKSKVSYTHIGHVRSLSQLECLLKEAKNIRNAVMHEVADGAVNPMKFDEIVKAMHDVIDEAGNVYSIPADEVTSFKSQVDGMWDEVRTDSEKAKAYCRFFLQTYGNKEAKVMWEAMLSEETLLFGDDNVECSKVFHSLELTLQKPKDQLECKISYTELLTGNDKFIVVIGDSGSGKSTLAKNLVIQHHGISDAEVEMFNLKNHNLLLYYECRNVSTKEFTDVVEENFKKVCQKLGPKTVIQGITESNPLILIDGYDECHKDSYKVVQQMVNKMRNHECRVIITTRPSAADRLKDFLKREGVKFQENEIAEICDLDDQLIFLEKYEKHVTPHAEKVVKSFSSLGPNIQELFVRPINLVLFCHMVWNFPEKINDWKSHAAVAQVTYDLYRKIIKTKLASCVVDMDGLIDYFFQDLGDFSLKMICEGHLVFSPKQVADLISRIRLKLEKYGALEMLDPNALLGVVLKIKRPMKSFESCTYFFHHKSIQELFASKAVLMELRKNNALPPILTSQKFNIFNPLGVLTYVFMELSAAEESTVFWNNWPLLRDAVGGVAMHYWEQILLNCRDSQHIAEAIAEVFLANSDNWSIETDHQVLTYTGRNVDAIALLLPYKQPALLSVSLLDDPAPESWREVARTFKGILELRLLKFLDPCPPSPCDHMLGALNSSSCSLSLFAGCIKDTKSIQSLAEVATPNSDFLIVTELHVDLTPLQHKHQKLWVIVEPTSEGDIAALPASPHIFLLAKSVAENQQESLTRTLLGMAPADNRLRRLEVRDCALTEMQLLEAVAVIQSKGLRTLFRDNEVHAGPSRVLTMREKNYALILTDEPPLPPQAEPSRRVASEPPMSPASLPVAPVVGGENLCPLASSCGDLDAVYRSLYALNVVLPHALRFVMEKVCRDKPPEVTYWDYILAMYEQMDIAGIYVMQSDMRVMDRLKKYDCEEIDIRPFDAHPLIEFLLLFIMGWSMKYSPGIVDPIVDEDYKKILNLMEEVRSLRMKVITRMMKDLPELVGLPDRITEIAYELISEAAELHRVPDAEAERVKEACQALWNKYSDVRVDDDAFAAYYVLKENWERRVDLEFEKLFDERCVKIYKSPSDWKGEPFSCVYSSRVDRYQFDESLKDAIHGKLHGVFIHFKCRDTKSRSFSDVIEENFPEACSKIGAPNVEYVMKRLHPLILVDGYDEANATSSVVIEEMVYKFCKFVCKIVITTGPEADSSQRNISGRKGVDCEESLILSFALKLREFFNALGFLR
ncbi:uncharacterized protein LOC108681457 [Hyalella azteca]|uniref:Uncharacterized protein LOC108681457 n=1 Tax=Hyalella azteca TaxID=294128 RepID=A0A979FL91_HYAAZ|nr:uncharacterized protein LOC108681457 [Hyalella azteca]